MILVLVQELELFTKTEDKLDWLLEARRNNEIKKLKLSYIVCLLYSNLVD
jgi:hypothetical protein